MTKVTGWTKEVAAKLVAAYAGGETPLKELAGMFGKTEAAIRGKLVAEGVYVKKGGTPEKAPTAEKAEYVNAIRILTGLTGLESLEKANKADLEKLATYLTNKF